LNERYIYTESQHPSLSFQQNLFALSKSVGR